MPTDINLRDLTEGDRNAIRRDMIGLEVDSFVSQLEWQAAREAEREELADSSEDPDPVDFD